ncbi:helix-turn-helix domain-containing protein [Nocardia niigatensis]
MPTALATRPRAAAPDPRLLDQLTPVDDVRRHIRWLLGLGFCEQAIAAATLVDRVTPAQILTTTPTHIPLADTAEILAVSHVPVPAQAGCRVPALGAARRIHALQALGWPLLEIATAAGLRPRAIHRLTRARSCSYAEWASIRDLYHQLSTQHGPSPYSRGIARSRGFIPPRLWVGHDIDHPDSDPAAIDAAVLGAQRRFQALVALGHSPDILAPGLDTDPDSDLIAALLGDLRAPRAGQHEPITPAVVRAVAAQFDRRQMIPGTCEASRRRGEIERWPLPMDWDEDDLDNPDATTTRTIADFREIRRDRRRAAVELLAAGKSARDIAARLGVDERTIFRDRRWAENPDNLATLTN